jgi:hypothetical protein
LREYDEQPNVNLAFDIVDALRAEERAQGICRSIEGRLLGAGGGLDEALKWIGKQDPVMARRLHMVIQLLVDKKDKNGNKQLK